MSEDPDNTLKFDSANCLRTITLLDKLPVGGPNDPPVHVAQRLLLNGEPNDELLDPRFGWEVSAGNDGATVVSFVANAHQVQVGKRLSDGRVIGRTLGGVPVLTPRDLPWMRLSDSEIEKVIGNDVSFEPFESRPDLKVKLYNVRGLGRTEPLRRQVEPPDLIRVYVFVREVRVVAADQAEVPAEHAAAGR